MVEVVNKSWKVLEPGLKPKVEYSRVVSCAIADDGIPGPDYAFTTVVGQKVMLRKVTVWWDELAVVIANNTDFMILTGTGLVNLAADILGWEDVLPLQSTGMVVQPWRLYDGRGEMSWEMRKQYVGVNRRFGIWADRRQDPGLNICVSFEVSEG